MAGSSRSTVKVKIPVQLELEQIMKQMQTMQNALNQVRPNTNEFKELQGILNKLQRQYMNIAVVANGAFSTGGAVDSFEKQIQRMGSEVDLFTDKYLKLGHTSFISKDMIPAELLGRLQEVDNQIEDIRISMNEVRNVSFREAVEQSKELSNTLKSVGVTDLDNIESIEKKLGGSLNTAAKNVAKTGVQLDNQKGQVAALTAEYERLKNARDAKSGEVSNVNAELNKEQAELARLTAERENEKAQAIEEATKKYREQIAVVSEVARMTGGHATKEDRMNSSTLGGIFKLTDGAFNDKSKASLIELLKEKVGLDDSQIDALKNASRPQFQKLVKELLAQLQKVMDEKSQEASNSVASKMQDIFSNQEAKISEIREKIKGLQAELDTLEQNTSSAQSNLNRGQKRQNTAQTNYDAAVRRQEELTNAIEETRRLEEQANKEAQNSPYGEELNKELEERKKINGEIKNQVDNTKGQTAAAMKNGEAYQNLANKAEQARIEIEQIDAAQNRLNTIKSFISRWFGFYEVVRLTRQAVSSMLTNVKELDSVMTEISIVTDFTQDDLWGQMKEYSAIAQEYGVSIKGVYEVSQLYYQQGLKQNEVMQLTTETLKMAKIAGLSYSDASDYMTVALRGFRMEMSEASRIVDVYSEVAAISATDTSELATAMSKTASSAEAVGSSFENTTAMMAVMIETTRESATNIGSAMKSIISRYGELTSNPKATVDEDGEVLSLNRVDAALQSVGMTLQTADGQFRDFDDVIIELASHWDELDSVSQRYIATVFAGNRQQSRFLALVSNYDRLVEIIDAAENSEDAGTVQALKTMDSIASKWEQIKTSFQEFYTSTGIQSLIKTVLDAINNILKRLNGITKLFNKLPVAAVGEIAVIVKTIKTSATLIASYASKKLEAFKKQLNQTIDEAGAHARQEVDETAQHANQQANGAAGTGTRAPLTQAAKQSRWGLGLSAAGASLSAAGLMVSDNKLSGALQIGGGLMSGAGAWMMSPFGWKGKLLMAVISALPGIISGFSTLFESTEEKLAKLNESITEAHNKSLISKDSVKTLDEYEKKLKDATAAQYNSAEAKKEYYDLMNEIGEAYPELISYIDEEGNKIVRLGEQYDMLAASKKNAYLSDLTKESATNIGALFNSDYINNAVLGAQGIERNEVYGTGKGKYNAQAYISSIAEQIRQDVEANRVKTLGEYLTLPITEEDYEKFKKENFLNRDEERKSISLLLGQPANKGETDEEKAFIGAISYRTAQGETLKDIFNSFTAENQFQELIKSFDYNAWNYLQSVMNGEKTFSVTDVRNKRGKNYLKNLYSGYNSTFDLGYTDFELEAIVESEWSKVQDQLSSMSEDEISEYLSQMLEAFSYGYQQSGAQIDTVYSSLEKSQKDALSELSEDSTQYSESEYRQKVSEIVGENNTEVINAQMEYYREQLDWGTADFIAALQQQGVKNTSETSPLATNLSATSQQKLIALLERDDELNDYYQQIYSDAADINDILVRKKAEVKLNKADLTSFTGIYEAIDDIRSINKNGEYDTLVQSLIDLSNNVEINFTTELGNYINTAKTNFETFSDILSKATSGMDFSAALSAAERMGVSLKEAFDFQNGKYVLKSGYYEALKTALFGSSDEMLAKLQEKAQVGTISEEEQKLLDEAQSFSQQYSQYTINSALLAAGKFKEFALNTGSSDVMSSAIQGLAQIGDVRGVLNGLEEEVIQTYGTEIINAVSNYSYDWINSLSGAIDSGAITQIEADQHQVESLAASGFEVISVAGNKAWVQIKDIKTAYEYLDAELAKGTFTAQQYNSLRQSLTARKLSTPITKAVEVFSNLQHITEDTLISYANELGVNVNDFIKVASQNADGSYSLTLSQISDVVYGLNEDVISVAADAQAFLETFDTYISGLSSNLEQALTGATFSEALIISNKIGEDMSNLFTLSGDKFLIKGSATQKLIDYYFSSFTDAIAAYGGEISGQTRRQAIDYARTQAAKTLMDGGDYLSALEALYPDNTQIAEMFNKRDLDGLKKLGGADFGDNIVNGLVDQIVEAYEDIVSAFSSGKLIEADGENRLIYQQLAKSGMIQQVGDGLYKVAAENGIAILEAFIGDTALRIEETTDLIVSGMENLETQTDLASYIADACEAANRSSGVVRAAFLQGITNSLSNTAGRLANGISGTATASDIGALEKQFGIGISYKRTSEGLQIKKQSLYEMYDIIRNIDAISGDVVLTSLVDSAMDANEEMNDIWAVMNRISDLQEKIDKPNISDARKKELQAELKVAQGIYENLRAADDTFNFMERSVGSGYDDPLSAWAGMGDAFQVLEGEDYKKGLVSWQDFNNMITMMGDEALRAAGVFKDKTTTSADLLLAGAGALANVDGKTMVDLSKLGADFNLGAKGMKEGLTKGIHTLAANQIAMLDAEIKMLETIVETQNAYEALKGDKTELDASDFLPQINLETGEWDTNQQKLLETIGTYIGGLGLKCGMTAKEAFTNPENYAMLTDVDREFLAMLSNELFNGDVDWTAETGAISKQLEETINRGLQEYGYEGWSVSIDLSKLTVQYDTSSINLDSSDFDVFSEKQKELIKQNLEKTDKVSVSMNDLITWAADGDTGLANTLKTQVATTLTAPINEVSTKINEASTDLDTLNDKAGTFSEIAFDNVDDAAEKMKSLKDDAESAVAAAQKLKATNFAGKKFTAVAYDDGGATGRSSGSSTSSATVTADYNATAESLNKAVEGLQKVSDELSKVSKSDVIPMLEDFVNALTNLGKVLAKIPDKSKEMDALRASIAGLRSKSITLSAQIVLVVKTTGTNIKSTTTKIPTATIKSSNNGSISNRPGRNFGEAAVAKGTLMGELGPELVVSDGRYYVVGQEGAEFVNLADDAIVFNHLQTKKLLKNGFSGRGTAVTNERNAAAYATGNMSGPAMASASEALNVLKRIRAQWEALLNSSAQDLSRKAGSGGGGGGKDATSVAHDLERWYNLLRQIAKLEQQITYQQSKRANMKNGYDYVASLEQELVYLQKQQQAYKDLAKLQKSYYDARRKDLLSTDYSKIFTYDEDGLMQYVDGANRGLDILAKLNETDANGTPINNAKDSTAQLGYLKSIGFNIETLNINADGSTAEDDDERMQNFWENIDGWMDELDGLYDEYNEHLQAVEDNTAKQNEILQQYIDNQLAVENKLLQAIEDREQAIIDGLKDEKDALEKASKSYIDGLNKALNKEKNLYNKNQTEAETARLQRQLAILQRSGGSASEIQSLKDQIDSRLQDSYFDKMQDQIDAVEEASDKQLEKLQTQIDLMTETLEYQKENGLLWQEVYEMLNNWTPEKILQFIEEYTKSYKSNSNLQNEQDSQETLKQLQIFEAKKNRDRDWEQYYNNLDAKYADVKEANKDKAYAAWVEGYNNGGKSQAEQNANAVFEAALKGNNSTPTPTPTPSPTPTPTPSQPTEEEQPTRKAKFKNKNYKVYSYDSATTKQKGQIVYGNGVDGIEFTLWDEQGERILVSGVDGKGNKIEKRWVPKKYFQYKEGGLVDFTGPAWVDGTKSKPEAFLSADDTKLLKSSIFSNSSYSLKSTVEAIQSLAKSLMGSTSETRSESIVIENAEVSIQPGVIANDYDARRAGELALEEMVKIARKSGNRNIARR